MRVGIGGLGAVGMALVRRLLDGVEGLELAAASARRLEHWTPRMREIGFAGPVVEAGALAEHADVVVECMPSAAFESVAVPAIEAGRVLVPISVGALLEHPDLVDRARRTGARIAVPTGALLGLDAVRAAAEGEIESVTMVTRKPPGGLAGAPHLVENGIEVAGLAEPLLVFSGSAREGARGFPANVNVAAALGLAGIGPDRTRLEIWADPTVSRNTHRIVVEADSARFELVIENVPSEENPRTGRIVALSVLAALRRLVDPLVVGS